MKVFLKTALLTLAASVLLAGCTAPRYTAQTLDNRPQITFKTTLKASKMAVLVDGKAVGKVSDYLDGKATLRILPGTHLVEIVRPDGSKMQERIYAGDGVTKTIVVQ